MSQMTIPVESVRVATPHFRIHRIARQAMLPETGGRQSLEVGLVPYVGTQVAPFLHEGMEVGLIDSKTLGIGLRDELRLTGHWPYMLGILRFTKTHIIIAAHGIAERLEVDIIGDVEVHRAAYILHHEAIAPWTMTAEVNVPHIGADQTLATGLLLGIGSMLPELHHSGILPLLGVDVIEPHLLAFPTAIVALSTITQPQIEVGSMGLFGR